MTDTTSLAVLAGTASTALFIASTLPMLAKAYRTRDLASYSLGNLLLANIGNIVHSIYVLSLPLGPIWALHGFYTATTLTMLTWFLRYGVRRSTHGARERMGIATEAPAGAAS
jgi:hypothetical protein